MREKRVELKITIFHEITAENLPNLAKDGFKNLSKENQDGGIGRHTVPPRTTRTDRKSNGKEV